MSIIWSAKEVQILKQMLDAGITPETIALVLKTRTVTSIRNKVAREGWKIAPEPELDMDAFNKLMKGKK